MGIFLEQMLNGLTIGSFYALIALGYSMVYGVMKLINFAHGDLFTLGSYLGFTLIVWGDAYITSHVGLAGGMIAAILIGAIGSGIAGIIMEKIAYRPIYKAGRLPVIVSALGVSIFLQNIIMVIWGPRYQAYPADVVPMLRFKIGGVHITILQIILLIFSFVLLAVLYFIVQKTTFGAAIRASALDKETTALMGVNINTIIFFIFSLGPALGGAAGVMVGMYYRQISFTMGWNYGLKAFMATILGGIGNIPGAMVGGLILGIFEMLGSAYVSTAYKDVIVFSVFILVLIFRPRGLLGEKIAEKV